MLVYVSGGGGGVYVSCLVSYVFCVSYCVTCLKCPMSCFLVLYVCVSLCFTAVGVGEVVVWVVLVWLLVMVW